MKKLFAALSLALLAQSAAFAYPNWNTNTVQSVNIVPNYVASGGSFIEASTVLYVKIGNLVYASTYNNEKTKAWLQMATAALTSGKKIAIYSDYVNTLQTTSCRSYDQTGCGSLNTPASYTVIQEMAIVP